MDRDDLTTILALESCPGFGAITIKQLIQETDIDLASILDLPSAQLKSMGLSENQILSLKDPDWSQVEQALEWQQQDPTHHLLTVKDQEYPALLKEIRDPPPVLYAIGRVQLFDSPQISIVGSRNCTPGGAKTAENFAHYLSEAGLTITSGMALGIDKHAHLGALSGSGNTVAVIGTGIDRIYPSRNKQLAYDIAEKGLIVSEFPLGMAPQSGNFPRRNRVISGLSLATLVVEATRKSGSLITARMSIEQGREVFAIPGSIHNPQAKGCHHLIRQGAKLVDQAADIIDDIGSLLGYVAETAETTQHEHNETLDREYRQLLDIMGYDPVSIDTLVQRSGLTIDQLSSMLLILELNDFIQIAPGGLYQRC